MNIENEVFKRTNVIFKELEKYVFKTLATMHIVTKSKDIKKVKKEIREELEEHNMCHAILETEEEACDDKECHIDIEIETHHHHRHH